MKQKGQALIEFILILPIIILIFLALLDIGNIYMEKHKLNDSLENISSLYQAEDEKQMHAYIASENLDYDASKNGNVVKITIKKEIKISAPILSNALGKNYMISADKTFYINNNVDKEETDEQ